MQRAAWLGGFFAASLILAGCSSNNLAVVKGAVTFDGKPIEKGAINFYPADGKSSTAGGEIKDGQYSVMVPVGLMKVYIGGVPKVIGMRPAREGPGGKEQPITVESIPSKYADRNETVLQIQVNPGVNEKDWDLKSD
jgi:hypothetical protein